MVLKHILMNSSAKSSIRRLVNYITDPQDTCSRIERISIHNCGTDDPMIAARKMEAVQFLNKRTKADKSYHLLLSFPAGEEPTTEQLESIEADVCAALGYTEHQRISVVHRDTDNLHVHLAINKIHPNKLTIHEPHRDFIILAKAAELIEATYQLVKTNHATKKTLSENRIDDIQKMGGQETLATQIRANCLEGLQAARSWDEVHTICSKNGVALQLRGNGLVFTQIRDNGEVIAVKASTVSRDLSKVKLEARLGAYRAQTKAQEISASVKVSQPTVQCEPSPLWKRYVTEKSCWQEKSAAEKVRLHEERRLKKKLIDAQYKIEKADRRQSSLPYWQRQYRLLALRKEMAGRRKALTETGRVGGYLEWLQQQAMSGDSEALSALRRRAFGLAKSGNELFAQNHLQLSESDWPVDMVTKQGTVIYAVGKDVIRDRGESFHISPEAGGNTLAMAMKMAARRSGSCLTIAGNEAFQEQCLQAAVATNLKITFADAELEEWRKRMVEIKLLKKVKEQLCGMEML